MAKPKHGRWNNCTTRPSSSSSCPCLHALPRFPSPAVLSALAVIAATPTVAAGALPTPPPTFLCPFIERDTASSDVCVPPPPSTTTPSSSTRTPSLLNTKRGVVADRYIEGSDNLWRKTNGWILYGSTCCSSSATTSTSDTPSQPSPSQTPMPTSISTSTPQSFDTSVLPAGWNVATTSSNTESTIILALATVLAGFICIFMIGCLVWRRRKKRPKDIERKLGQRVGAGDDFQDNVQETDARGKMRMWAKASARWRSNVRQSARRRRKKPFGSSIVHGPPSPSPCRSQVSIVTPSVPSRRGSLVTEEPDDGTPPPDVPSRPVSPPTYGASLVPNLPGLTPSSAVSDPGPTLPHDRPHSTERGIHPSVIEADPLPYIPRSDGHVATDDKAQLARIRELASSPPIMPHTTSASTMQSVSAPELHEVEDDLEDLGVDLGQVTVSCHKFAFSPSFPPPPSEADVRFGYLDAHLRYGEGDDTLVPPSTPGQLETSFEASPSAPPIDYLGLEPSAPTLEGEDDMFQGWDGPSSCAEDSTSAVQDSAAGMPALSVAPTVSSPSHASFPSPRRSAARDSILPQYHP